MTEQQSIIEEQEQSMIEEEQDAKIDEKKKKKAPLLFLSMETSNV